MDNLDWAGPGSAASSSSLSMDETALAIIEPAVPITADRDVIHVCEVIRTVGEPTRFGTLMLLKHGGRSVGGIGRVLGVPQDSVSHHLQLLRNHGLIQSERRGKHIIYDLGENVRGHCNPIGGIQIRCGPFRVGFMCDAVKWLA